MRKSNDKLSESSSQVSEKRFRVMIENSYDIIALIDRNGKYTYLTPSIKNLGYKPKDLLGKIGFDYIHPDDLLKTQQLFRILLKKPYTHVSAELRFRHKNNSWRLLEAQAVNMLDDSDVKAIVCNFHDITAHKAADELLTESEHKFRYMADYAPVMIWVTTLDGYCTYLNKKWCEYTGQTSKTGLGMGWLSNVHPDDVKKTNELAVESIKKQKPFSFTYRLRRKDGIYRWMLTSGSPIFDHDGNIEGFIGSVIDINERIELERKKDEFMSIASHELKTPMTTLKAYTQILQKKFEKVHDEETLIPLDKMESQINKLTRLIADLLDVSRIEAGKIQFRKQQFAFYPLVKETIENVQAGTDTHTIVLKGRTTAKVIGDKDRLAQIITNLLNNAIKYSPNATIVEIRVTREKDQVYLYVQDFGIGISKKQLSFIFNRFYQGSDTDQRRKSYPGLGIGLFIAQEMAKHHGGHISVESKLGKGSAFRLQLPAISKKKLQ